MTTQILDGLNPAQQQAVQTTNGPVLVLAGPGAGKTGVIVRHVAYLIGNQAIDPHNILAVTFTNKAAREMRERLDGLLGSGHSAALTVGTFHSICVRFLRRDIIQLGRERDFAIYDSDDQLRVVKRVLKELNLDEKKHPPRAILGTISGAKNEFIDVAEFTRHARTYYDETVARCYVRYQQLLRESNALDFDDLLVETVRLFEQHPQVLDKYQERYRYVLADEYQDTNRVQYLLLKQLAAKYRNIFVVGDEDQSIYAFRGADIRNIRSFENDYPEATVILLEQNYRSTQAILDVAQAVINRSGKRVRKKQLWTENDQGTLVTIQEGYDQDEEARLAASETARLVASGEFRPGQVAIMYRTNAQSRAVEEALIAQGLRYYIVGGVRFYERKEVKDTLAYLRLALNPFDSVSFGRVLNWPARGIGQKSEDRLNSWAAQLNVPLYAALQYLAEPTPDRAEQEQRGVWAAPVDEKTTGRMLEFLKLLDEIIAVREEKSLAELVAFIFGRVSIEQALVREYGEEEGRDRWANVVELQNVATNYANMPQESQLATFLEEVALVSDVDEVKEERDAVTCITLHQAKGLEYPVVFLVGLEEGLIPHSRSLDDAEALDEERRLFYVGATRAKQRLYMLYAFRRTSYGRTNISQPSRFLADIPKDMIHQMPKRGYADFNQSSMFSQRSNLGGGFGAPNTSRVMPRANAPSTTPNTRLSRPAGPSEVSFFAGQKVRHDSFGDGVVVSSKIVDGDEEVTVAFAGKGVKRLLASFARLEKVE